MVDTVQKLPRSTQFSSRLITEGSHFYLAYKPVEVLIRWCAPVAIKRIWEYDRSQGHPQQHTGARELMSSRYIHLPFHGTDAGRSRGSEWDWSHDPRRGHNMWPHWSWTGEEETSFIPWNCVSWPKPVPWIIERYQHGEPHVREGLGREAAVADAEHVRHGLEQRPRVLLQPERFLCTA